jgi:GNAT superfamily N-acetyltransferase
MIRYTDSLVALSPTRLQGFCADWKTPPSPGRLFKALKGSSHVVLAIDEDTRRVIGYVNAVTDGLMCAFIPLLEVLPEYRGQGIGTELVRRLLERLREFYSVDLVCDDDLAPFYERFGLQRIGAMALRRHG